MYMYATHILSFSGVLRAATRLILLLSTSSHVGLYTIYLHVRWFIHSLVYMMIWILSWLRPGEREG